MPSLSVLPSERLVVATGWSFFAISNQRHELALRIDVSAASL
jgi:hypothetical protein